jgi:hypothetical protein
VITSRLLAPVFAVVVGGWAFADPPKDETKEFVSKDWKFAVKFPDKPKEKTQDGPMGIKMTSFSIESKNGALVVGVADMPIGENETEQMTQERLDGSRDGAIKNVGGKFVSSDKITLGKQKYPGREYTATLTKPVEGQMKCKTYIVGKRLYQVIVMGTNDFATSKEADKFLESFRLIE